MANNKKILIFEENIALGLDITWKLGHLGWKVTWLQDLRRVSETKQNIQVVLYSSAFADQFSEFTTYLRYYEDHQVPIGIIPSISDLTSSTNMPSNRYANLDYPFTLPNLKDVLDKLVEQSSQKSDFNEKINLLKKIEEIRSQLIHTTAHEIKTPITIILIAIEEIEGVLRKIKADVLEINHVRLALQEIQEIITTLENTELDYPYLNQPQIIQQIETYSFCKHIISNFCLSLPMKQRLQSKIQIKSSQSEIFALVEPYLFKRVITNLILNATKFSPEGEEITITLEIVDNELKLCVYDRGIGIHPEDLSHVTKPFYRSKNAIPFAGSGLGLSIVETCVTCQGGRLEIQSQLGAGTCVTVFFPTEIS
jgi:signal transduction histidine kinase